MLDAVRCQGSRHSSYPQVICNVHKALEVRSAKRTICHLGLLPGALFGRGKLRIGPVPVLGTDRVVNGDQGWGEETGPS